MTMTGDDLDARTAPRWSANGRRNGNGSDVRTVIAWMSLIITLTTLIFMAGYNWRRIDEVATAEAKEESAVDRDYVRKDVQQQQMLTVDGKFDQITTQLANIQRALERQNAR